MCAGIVADLWMNTHPHTRPQAWLVSRSNPANLLQRLGDLCLAEAAATAAVKAWVEEGTTQAGESAGAGQASTKDIITLMWGQEQVLMTLDWRGGILVLMSDVIELAASDCSSLQLPQAFPVSPHACTCAHAIQHCSPSLCVLYYSHSSSHFLIFQN
jgi:hypothetical protein